MIEKRCKIDISKATFISVECDHCHGETNIPMMNPKEVQVCGVCGHYFGEMVVRYIANLRKTSMINGEGVEVRVSLVSVEREG